MLEAIDKRALGLGGAALLVALIFTGLLGALRPDALLQWLMALSATLISVAFAVALFWYQRDKSDEARQEQLLISLVAEARACLDMLDERPAELRDLDGRELETAVMEPLPTIILD